MAAAVLTVETALEIVKLGRNDTLGAWLSDAQYRSLILGHVKETSNTRTFTAINSTNTFFVAENGRYRGSHDLLLFDSDTAPITGADDRVYEVSARGTIAVTTGAHTSSTITTTASVIDYGALMKDIFYHLAIHSSIPIAQSFGDISITPGAIFKYLLEAAEHWEGTR